MEASEHLRPDFSRGNISLRADLRAHLTGVWAMIVDFDDLQRLSGYRQVSKVVDWLREQKVAFVIGGDGKPRTTHDMLRTVLNGETAEEATPIRFG